MGEYHLGIPSDKGIGGSEMVNEVNKDASVAEKNCLEGDGIWS